MLRARLGNGPGISGFFQSHDLKGVVVSAFSTRSRLPQNFARTWVFRGTPQLSLFLRICFQIGAFPHMPMREQADRAMSVLLVEDDHLVRSSIREMLAAEEFNVLEASSGEQALEIWRQSPAGIDLLVTDISMPGMSGIDLVDQLGRQGGCLKALYISGFPELLDSPGAALRKVPFLRKPFRSSRYRARSAPF